MRASFVNTVLQTNYKFFLKTKNAPRKRFLRRAKNTRGTTQFAKSATSGSDKPYTLTRSNGRPLHLLLEPSTRKWWVFGSKLSAYTGRRLSACFRCRTVFVTVYMDILAQLFLNVKPFIVVKMQKYAVFYAVFCVHNEQRSYFFSISSWQIPFLVV